MSTWDWQFHLNIFVIYISKLLCFRGSFCFTCLVSSFRSLSFLRFSPRKNSWHCIVFKSPFLWRKVYVTIRRKVLRANFCASCHLEVILFWGYCQFSLFDFSISEMIWKGTNSLDPDQDQRSFGPDLGSNCLQRLTADYKSHCLQGQSLNAYIAN